jgi:fucose 4-O-acetylase-like acetyltransferase
MMGQCVGAPSYQIFSAGFSLAVYILFYILADVVGLKIGIFRTLGTNALFGYALHGLVDRAVKSFMPQDSPEWYVWTGFAVFFWITWLMLRALEKRGIYIKL